MICQGAFPRDQEYKCWRQLAVPSLEPVQDNENDSKTNSLLNVFNTYAFESKRSLCRHCYNHWTGRYIDSEEEYFLDMMIPPEDKPRRKEPPQFLQRKRKMKNSKKQKKKKCVRFKLDDDDDHDNSAPLVRTTRIMPKYQIDFSVQYIAPCPLSAIIQTSDSCYLCGGEKNECSQLCGKCARKLWRIIREKPSRIYCIHCTFLAICI